MASPASLASNLTAQQLAGLFPDWLRQSLARLQQRRAGRIYLAGGTVRDLLLGRSPQDIDLTIRADARLLARELAALVGGTYVPLGRNEDAARVVHQGVTVDVSAFREGATSFRQELGRRDLTINALGCCLSPLLGQGEGKGTGAGAGTGQPALIDPLGGLADLEQGRIRHAFQGAFQEDPLRLLRVYRFAASLGFTIKGATTDLVQRQRQLIAAVAPERIHHELDLIMASGRAAPTLSAMVDSGLFWELLPELRAGQGMAQPASHHLDVFGHSLEALLQMEALLASPSCGYAPPRESLALYGRDPANQLVLKWAALFHDVGKPRTHGIDQARGGRITFYNHDQVGAALFAGFAERYRWSSRAQRRVARLISQHMRPFHLANVARQGPVSTKACIRLLESLGEELAGLFLLAMADARAGQGSLRPEEMEAELGRLYDRLETVARENVAPVLEGEPLLTGRDLIGEFGLVPGPLFKVLLKAVTEARMEQRVVSREQALALVAELLAEREES
ncbi:CCA tRNA nucleotidyltransferase [Desulfogranum mediterraneum]|uniref:CCA tRNA nucleotidyltransferase n=1 Tax=Desulfogranum mediterraneum TaxID=160661 RepID=UPI0013783060|nr:HD domain-containing protein [Desulfogranum mediterraneum]